VLALQNRNNYRSQLNGIQPSWPRAVRQCCGRAVVVEGGDSPRSAMPSPRRFSKLNLQEVQLHKLNEHALMGVGLELQLSSRRRLHHRMAVCAG
jgi:hypothetical protein